ncbi:MAG: DNA polymerase III subunit delta [Gammaproteobacteria bacterium]|nr:DNA polymerase III subunit delta [Gammaproteobacteria bacterium]
MPACGAHESRRAVRTTPDALPAGLARGLRSAYLVTGFEPLLIAEAAAAVRQAARAAGYADREVHFVERGFDWDELLRDSANLSLFAARRLIELKFNSTPDAESQRALAGLAAQPPADTILLVTGELERKSLGTQWVKSFEDHGVLVVAQVVERGALPGWIRDRLAQQGVRIEPAAAQLLADRVEGNLLAAQQEVERIGLLMPGATLGPEDVASVVADSARYDVFELSAAAFAGNASRALRVLSGLRSEGQEPPLILWALVQDLRALSRVAMRVGGQRSLDEVFRAEQVWSNRQGPIRAALSRHDRRRIDALIAAAARADRVAKGSLRGDAWVEIEGLVAKIAGVRLAA